MINRRRHRRYSNTALGASGERALIGAGVVDVVGVVAGVVFLLVRLAS